MKKTGDMRAVELMTDLPWGSHCCFFYESEEHLLDILVPFFKAGLLHNEFCIWVTSKFPQPEQAMRAMRKALPNFDSYLKKGQIEILPFTEWYVKEGVFDRQRVLAGWIEKFTEVSAKGYDGMRLTGDALWLEKTSWKNLTEYEAELDKTINNYRIKDVCTYFLDQCEASDIVDVAKNHGYALIKRGTWELIENSQRKRAEERAHEKAMSELEKAVELRTEELRRSQKQLRSLAPEYGANPTQNTYDPCLVLGERRGTLTRVKCKTRAILNPNDWRAWVEVHRASFLVESDVIKIR